MQTKKGIRHEPIIQKKGQNGMSDVIAILNLQNDNDATEEVDAAIRAAEKEFEEEGKLFDAREMLSGLRRKYFGS